MLNAWYEKDTDKIKIELDQYNIDLPATRTERIFESGETYIDIGYDENDNFLRFIIFPSDFISETAKLILPSR